MHCTSHRTPLPYTCQQCTVSNTQAHATQMCHCSLRCGPRQREHIARRSSIERASPPHFQTPMLWCCVCVDPAESCALCVAAGAERCTAGSFAPATSSAYTMSDSTGARLVPALCTCGAWPAIASCRCCTSCPALAKYSCSNGACGLLKLGSRCCMGATSSGLVVAGLYGAEAANSSWWRKA